MPIIETRHAPGSIVFFLHEGEIKKAPIEKITVTWGLKSEPKVEAHFIIKKALLLIDTDSWTAKSMEHCFASISELTTYYEKNYKDLTS